MQEPEPEQDTKQPLPPSSPPSEHTSSTLSPNRGIQIPSKHDYFTSGFAYPPFLADYDISPHHWTQFTHDLNEEVKLSPRQWATTVAKGVSVLALGGMMAGVLGAIPAVLVARKARRNREEMNLIIAASERPADTDSGSRLLKKVERWNETFFRPRGIVVRVDLPWEELDEMQGMEVLPASRYGSSRRDEQAAREDASRKARIVIIPVDTDPSGSGSGSASASNS
ncbi:hypothetical protein Aspvir_003302 [Aspergillus viridinutans]|uniref:Uncharacterized protein n=1 Tax=Aspergillus viridinutans TaxID=75553 RepID=A0A9P3C9G3_ASPVI|nr:uncharacterized protein Aspvir_003302 [Aspergillus viridinutans]GIK07636.1 hypothetical protein Aspvir_003302 [Aspergillus viridinutans]